MTPTAPVKNATRRLRRQGERAKRTAVRERPRPRVPAAPAWPEGLRPAKLAEVTKHARPGCGLCRGEGFSLRAWRARPCKCAVRGFVSSGGQEYGGGLWVPAPGVTP